MNIHNYYIYSNFDFSIKSAGCTRMFYYAKALADKSHRVFLVSCCSNKFSDQDFVEIEPNIFLLDKKKLTTNFILTFRFLKTLDCFSQIKKGSKSFLFYPSPLIFLEVLALLYLKGYKRYRVFNELNEVRKHTSSFHNPITIFRIKYSFKKIIYKSVFTLLQGLLPFYDGLICISTSIENYGKRFNENTMRIPILTDPNISISKSKNKYITKGKFNIGFSGSIHPTKENLEDFINVLKKIENEGFAISFNLCGIISDEYCNYLLEKSILKNSINYYGNLSELELSTFLSQQDLLVIPRGYSLQNKYGFSTKLSDYLNHKKVILLTDVSDNNLFIKDGVNGFLVPPDNQQAMYDKLIYIINNFDKIKSIVIPNSQITSKNEFNYLLFRTHLQNFMTK